MTKLTKKQIKFEIDFLQDEITEHKQNILIIEDRIDELKKMLKNELI